MKICGYKRLRCGIDGPGVRSLVAMCGCNLRCEHCFNKHCVIPDNKVIIEVDAHRLLSRVMWDYCYFVATGGGVTFGGGEPLLQIDEILDFLSIVPSGVNVIIETNLTTESPRLLELLNHPKLSMLIIDVKDMNPRIYQEYTRKPISNLSRNLNLIAENGLQSKCKVRIPLIPNFNTTQDQQNSIKILRNLGFENLDTFKYKTQGIGSW